MSLHKLLIVSISVIVTSLIGSPQDAMARSGNLSSLFGTISFNGKQINLPSRNEKKIELNQGDIKPKRIGIEPRITGVADKLGNRPYADIVDEKAKKYGVFPELVHAVIQAESSYNPRAVSPVGAVGLMQLMPGTAKRFGVRDSTNPRQNIDGGVRYLRFLLDYFENNLRLAVAGYNAGENAVIKHGRKIPPYKETRQYVTRVMKYLHRNLDKTQSQHLSSLI